MRAPLEKTQEFLARHGWVSAREIARGVKCSLPTVYRRIRQLTDAGISVAETRVARSQRGPHVRKFLLVKEG